MSVQEYQQNMKDRVASWHLRQKFIWLVVIALLIAAAAAAIYMWYPYSDGTRTGYLRKLSHKGYAFKTWEGELQMPGISGTGDGNQMPMTSTIWAFSVNDDAVISQLQEAERTGVRVTLHYKQYMKQFDWRGETVYFVDGVMMQK